MDSVPWQSLAFFEVTDMKAIDIAEAVTAACFLGLCRFKLGSFRAATVHASHGVIGST
jgi:hypothetical protein